MTTATQPTRLTYKRPWLYPKQLAAMFGPERYAVTEASTKSGKTVSALAWLTEQALGGREGHHYWWGAPVHGQARIAYTRMKRAFPIELMKTNDTEQTVTLPNGAIMDFKSGEKPDHLYGEDVYAAVIDEASRFREESWHAIRSTLTATRGPVRIIGNVRGRRNWFYRMARRAEDGEPGMSYQKITAFDAIEAGVLVQAEIDDAQRQLPESVFRELYLAEASDDEGNPFGMTAIQDCVAPGLSPHPVVVWGVDLGKRRTWTVLVGLDTFGAVAAFERFQMPWEETISRIASVTAGTALVKIDATGVGDPIVERLQRLGTAPFEAFVFTTPSKQQIMEGLAVAIQSRETHYPDGPIVNELESFEYTYTRTGVLYTAPVGMYDDCVDALALAVSGIRIGGGYIAVPEFVEQAGSRSRRDSIVTMPF